MLHIIQLQIKFGDYTHHFWGETKPIFQPTVTSSITINLKKCISNLLRTTKSSWPIYLELRRFSCRTLFSNGALNILLDAQSSVTSHSLQYVSMYICNDVPSIYSRAFCTNLAYTSLGFVKKNRNSSDVSHIEPGSSKKKNRAVIGTTILPCGGFTD